MKRTAVIVALSALVLAGCSKASNTNSNPSADQNSSSTQPSSSAVVRMSATLHHLPAGTVTVAWSAKTKTVTVTGVLTGLAPNSTHPMHIHTGSCEKQGGVIHPLANLVADASGVGKINASVPGIKTPIPSKGWYVNVHTGPTLKNAAQFRPIACANLAPGAAKGGTQTFSKSFRALPGVGNDVKGSALLAYQGQAKTLTVTLTITGLDPNSLHAAHVHAGSCEAQGAVVYPLKNVKANAQGSATLTTTLSNVAAPKGPMYVNIHSLTDLTTQVGFTPIACGNLAVR